MSNRRLVGPKWPSKDSNPASSKALRNTKEGIDLEFLTVFFFIGFTAAVAINMIPK